jgi:hypothetical protein
MDKLRLNDGSAQEQQCHHRNTHHTDNQTDHAAPAYSTHKPYTNNHIDNDQDTHPQHTDKTDDAYLPTTIFTKLEKIFRSHNAHNLTSTHSYQDTVRGIVLIGNPATSYGPYANDPLDEQKANCKIAW